MIVRAGQFGGVVDRARRAGADIFEASSDVLEAASPVRTPSGIVAIAHWEPGTPDAAFASTAGVILGLVDVQDPGNAER